VTEARLQTRLVLGLTLRRMLAQLRRPRVESWLPALLTAAVIAGLLAMAAGTASEAVLDPAGAAMVGFLVAAPLSFFGYGVLFRAPDGPLLLRTGVAPGVIFTERAVRYLVLALALVVAVVAPFLLGGGDLAGAVVTAGAAGILSAPIGLLAFTGAADLVATGRGRMLASGLRDRELAAAAPLIYAPLVPLVAGIIGAMVAAAAPGGTLLVGAVAAPPLIVLAGRLYARSLPRSLAATGEMRYEPPSSAVADFGHRRGLAALLPGRVGALRARDVAVVERRFRWAVRLAWPVVLGTLVAVARWGGDPSVRGWVVALAGGLIVLQGVALIGLGWSEGRGTRWFDRSLGAGRGARYLGRWAAGISLALWTVVPVAIIWALWAPVGGAAWWIAAGVVVPGAAAVISVAAAGAAR
jgi:hypothetical protein